MRSRALRRRGAYRAATDLVRLIDGDEHSLSSRLQRAVAALPPDCTVLRFTDWYTGRPPVHEAVGRRRAPA